MMNTLAGVSFLPGPLSLGVILIIIGLALVFLYLKMKKTIFRIDYSGGNIGFDLNFITEEESHEFQKVLRNYKDIDENNRNKSVDAAQQTVQTSVKTSAKVSSVPEKIKEYNELYQQGVLTKEEFETQKKRLLESDGI